METASFHWVDYLVFSLSLVMGVMVGVVVLIKGRSKKTTTEEYLLGGKSLNVIAVGASLLASSLNAIFLLGGVAEISYRGAIYSLVGVAFWLVSIPVVLVYVPLWRKIQVTSAYEYIERRFNSFSLRLWGAALFTIKTTLFLSVVFYTPAMALSQVTGLNFDLAVVLCGFVCALYTVLGGLKAVVLVDTAQAFLMLAGLLLLCIMGTIRAGGTAYVFQTANELGRINFNNFSLDPRERHTVWTLVFGYTINWQLGHLSDQIIVQRYMAVDSTKKAQWAAVISAMIASTTLLMVASVGIIASVYYKDCDPLKAGFITAQDQLLPYFFMDLLGPYYGLPGLFIAAIFAAALSTVSSSVNSLSAVFLVDFLQPLMTKCCKPMPVDQEHIYARVISGVFGIVAIALSYMAPLLGRAIIQIPVIITGAIGGPLTSIFCLGFFVPWANKWGAGLGSLIGLVLSLWMALGAMVHGTPLKNLPVGICESNVTEDFFSTFTPSTETTAAPIEDDPVPLGGLYDVSYVWLATISVASSMIAGLLVSALVNLAGYGEPSSSVDTNLLWHYSVRFCVRSSSQSSSSDTHDSSSLGIKPSDAKKLDTLKSNENGGSAWSSPSHDPLTFPPPDYLNNSDTKPLSPVDLGSKAQQNAAWSNPAFEEGSEQVGSFTRL